MPPRNSASIVAADLVSIDAEHAAELARVADGGAVTRDTIIAAATIAATAAELLAALPLSPYWRGYVARWGDDIDRMLSIADAADIDTTNTGGR